MSEIVELSEEQVFAITGAIDARIIKAKALVRNGTEVVSLGGLAEVKDDDRLWAFLDTAPISPQNGLKVIRAMSRVLNELNRDVCIQCDGDFAERLLTVLGFKPTDELRKDWRTGEPRRVYQWHP